MYVESRQIADENEVNEWFQVEEISPIAEPKPAATTTTRVRELGDATDLYLGEIGRADLLTADQEKELARLVQQGDQQARAQMIEANDRLARMLQSQAPEKLVQDATVQLQARVDACFDALLTPWHLLLGERQLFSARTVIAPGAD